MQKSIGTALRPTLAFLSLALALPSPSVAQSLSEQLRVEIARHRTVLDALPTSAFVDSERPRVKGQLDDADSLLRADRVSTAVETLASAIPGVGALARASTGWDDSGKGSGKHLDALQKEWEEVGRALKAGGAKFPPGKSDGQSAFLRAVAEQSLGQIDEHYAVAVDYGRFSGLTSGAYYLGRAEGHLTFALFLSRLTSPPVKQTVTISTVAIPIATVESEIVTAYAKPGSTAQHTNFIIANSSLKLARDLDGQGRPLGALVTVLRSLFALTLATMPPPAADREGALSARVDAFEKQLGASKHDQSIGEAFVEKARIALEKSRAGGEASDRERLRAAALLDTVVPRYVGIMEGLEK